MRKLLRELLFLKKGEQRALFIVGFLLLISLAIRIYIPRQKYMENIVDEDFANQVALLKEKIDSLSSVDDRISKPLSIKVKEMNPSPFDPNTVTKTRLEEMHFPSRIASNLLSYRRAGGLFFTPEDMRKIYGMDSLTFEAIENFICIELREHKPAANYEEYIVADISPVTKFELNMADSTELIKIYGIGPVFSGRIIKYRNLLGAYYSIDQLWEVYGMDSIKFQSLKEVIFIDTAHIPKIDINTATFKKMISHPYLTRKEVSSLLHYRDYAEKVNDLAELRSAQVLDSALYRKIRPYIRCGASSRTSRGTIPAPNKQSAPSAKTNSY